MENNLHHKILIALYSPFHFIIYHIRPEKQTPERSWFPWAFSKEFSKAETRAETSLPTAMTAHPTPTSSAEVLPERASTTERQCSRLLYMPVWGCFQRRLHSCRCTFTNTRIREKSECWSNRYIFAAWPAKPRNDIFCVPRNADGTHADLRQCLRIDYS